MTLPCSLSKHMVCNEVWSWNTKAQLRLIHTIKQSQFSVTCNFTDTWGSIRKFPNGISFSILTAFTFKSLPSQPNTGSPASVLLLEALVNILCSELRKCCLQPSWTISMSWHLIPFNANFSSEHQKSQTVLHLDSTEGAGQQSCHYWSETGAQTKQGDQYCCYGGETKLQCTTYFSGNSLRPNLPTGIIKCLCTDVASEFWPCSKNLRQTLTHTSKQSAGNSHWNNLSSLLQMQRWINSFKKESVT